MPLQEFVQHCLLPRLLNSPGDALYSARFLRKVHAMKVPGFSLLVVLQQVSQGDSQGLVRG